MRWLKQFAPEIGIGIFFLLLSLFFFYPQTLGGKTLIPSENLYQYEPYRSYAEVVHAPTVPHNHLVSDLILQNYQWKSFIREQLALGEVPLWNPHQFAGIPFLAAGQHSALYPLSAIYYILPLWLAYGWFTVVNLWLAGYFSYRLGRGLGLSRAGATLAGVVYQLCGFVLASVVFQMMIGALPWLPVMILMAEYIIRKERILRRDSVIAWLVIGAIAIGLNILAGHVEISIYSLLITGYFAACRWIYLWWQTRAHAQALKTAASLLLMVFLGIGLAGLQFIPLYPFAQSNWRAERGSYETVISYAHPIRDMVQFFMPNFYGNPSQHGYFDVFTGQAVDGFGTAQSHNSWSIKNYVEAALYLGILPLILALYASLSLFRRGDPMWSPVKNKPVSITGGDIAPPLRLYIFIFATLGLLSLSFMFGLPTYRLIYALPGINQLNSAFRWIFALSVCVAFLAGFGLDALLSQVKHAFRLGLVVTISAILLLGGLAVSYFAYPQFESLIERLFTGLALADTAFGTAKIFYSVELINALIFAVMLLLSGLILLGLGIIKTERGKTFVASAAILLVAGDLMLASWGFNGASDPALLDFTPPVVAWLVEQYDESEPFRYTTLEAPNQPPILNANVTLRYGLDDIRGYDSIIPSQYVDYLRLLAPPVQLDYNRIAPVYTDPDFNRFGGFEMYLDSPLFDLLNVRYVVSNKETIVPFQEWGLVYEDEVLRVWENDSVVPRQFLVPAESMLAEWLPPTSAAPDFYARDVLPPYEAVRLSRNTGREKFMDITLTSPQWLMVSENYADGWKAFIRPLGADEEEEQPLEVVLVAGMFQGVDLSAIPNGDYSLRLVYSPTSVQVGFFASAISAAFLTLLVGMWLWILFVGVNTAESSQSARVARNSLAPIILNLFNRGIDFVLAIVLYRLLSPESVGIYNFAIVVFIWFDIFSNFGLDLFLIREVSREKAKSAFYLFNTSFLRFFLSVIGLGLLLLFLVIWQNAAEALPQAGLTAMILLYLGLFPASLSKGMTSLYYAHEQAEKPAAIATITTINKAVFSVIVLLFGWGIVGLAGVSIFNNFITLGVLVWQGREFIGQGFFKKPDFALIRGMVKESYPLLLNHFLATIFFQIDIVILQALKGSVLQAQYSTSYKWLNALNIVPSFFTQALFPVLSRQAAEDKAKFRLTYRFGMKLLFALTLPVAIGISTLATPMTLILAGAPYLPNGAIALQIMIWSIPIGWMNSLTQYALIALDLQRYITRAFFVAVTFNIVTNFIFIPIYGFQAAAVTTILSELVLLIPFGILMQRGLGQSLAWVDLLWRPLVAGGIMLGIVWFLGAWSQVGALFLASGVYLVVLFALRPLDSEEMAILRPMLPQKLARYSHLFAK